MNSLTQRKNKKGLEQKQAFHQDILSHVYTLMAEAGKAVRQNPSRANRYVAIARKLAMKHNVKLPPSIKRRICSHCYSYLQPGQTARVRLRNKKLVWYCFSCKKHKRIPYIQRRSIGK